MEPRRWAFLLSIATLWLTQSAQADWQKYSEAQLPQTDRRWGSLKGKIQILVHLKRNFDDATQKEVESRLSAAGGVFLYFRPERSLIFLGDEHVWDVAQKMHSIITTEIYHPRLKLSKQWRPIRRALNAHSVSSLATTPLHELRNGTVSHPDEHHFFGKIVIDQTSHVDRLVIEVSFPKIDNDLSYAPAQAAAHDWLIPLRDLFGPEIDMRAFLGLLEVFVPVQSLDGVLHYLSLQYSVHFLHPKSRLTLHNWRASGIIQSSYAPEEETGLIDPVVHPIWAAGLRGDGQIVGCGDSGVDVDSCFFYDPSISVLDNIHLKAELSINAAFESDTHRKIQFYGSSSMDFSDSDGHGTHVVGTLVGQPFDDSDDVALANQGMAPDARVAFLDLGDQSGDNQTESIFTPRELASYYYPLTYRRGARVHSDSWGSESPAYDHLAQEVDKFVWEHQDFLPVFAAGNYGQLASKYLTTVTSPAVAKNCLSVGATLTADQSRSFRNDRIDAYRIEVKVTGAEGDVEVWNYKILGAEFGAGWNSLMESSRDEPLSLVMGDPETGCSTLSITIRRKVVLLKRGDCPFVQKLMNAQSKAATGVILMNNQENGYFKMESTDDTADSEFTIPIASVPLSIGRQLEAVLSSQSDVTIRVMEKTEPENAFDNVADFSSSGPTIDRRIKPDIVAPGRIKSVWSDGRSTAGPGQCLLKTSSGTSMATPVVAGAAVLVRQYFVDGYYPTGQKTPKNAHTPSAALIKGALLGGAFAMDGYTEEGLPLEPPPSSRQGFGRVLLETSIPVEGSRRWRQGWRLQVIDGANLTQGASHEYCVRALGGPIRVTLVWTDPPASPSADSILTNDLDLSVRSAGLKGRELLGNGMVDRLNNVEKVMVDDMPEGNLAIVVAAHKIVASFGVQPYALVVQGHFNGILQSAHNPYQSEAPSKSDLCIITLAVLQSGPEGAINDSNPEFTFATQSGVMPVNGFECKLTDMEGRKDGFVALHDWQSCSSPRRYRSLPDKEYIFTVRPKNEDVEVRQEFIVDTEAPVAEIEGDPVPEESAVEIVRFRFSAEDLTAVAFSCRLTLVGRKRGVNVARLNSHEADLKLDSWFPCTSPETFRGLTHGNWTFSVRGEDKAGNIQKEATSLSWRIVFLPDRYYVRSLEAPLAISASPNVTFRLQVITGDAFGSPVVVNDAPIECLLTTAASSSFDASSYRECSRALQIPDIADGDYVFRARTQDPRGHEGESVSLVEFSVDSTAPQISFFQAPNEFHGARNVVLKFQANEELAGYNCSMRPRGAAARFIQCPGNEPETVNYQLEDGWYTFQVKAEDLAGNFGYSKEVTFMIDSIPPRILFTAPAQFSTNNQSIDFEFRIEDTGSGTDAQNVSCSLVNEMTGDRLLLPDGCSSPVALTLEEGRYLYTLRAADRAGLVGEKDLPIIVDFTPPSINWTTTPASNEVLPAFVVFHFRGSDEPKEIASLVTKFECKLRSRRRGHSNDTQVVTGRRRLQSLGSRVLLQANASSSAAAHNSTQEEVDIRIRDGAKLTLGKWIECEEPVVLTGMPSGEYGFQVRAIDHAGNTGEPTSVAVFTVDDTLPVPGEFSDEEPSDDVAISQTVAIGIAAASVVFVLSMCVVVGCWRRRSRRRRIEKRNAQQVDSSAERIFSRNDQETSSGSGDPILAAAMKASLQQQKSEEEERRRNERETEERRVYVAMQHSREHYDYEKAVERSLYES